jgi:hypothetical protein
LVAAGVRAGDDGRAGPVCVRARQPVFASDRFGRGAGLLAGCGDLLIKIGDVPRSWPAIAAVISGHDD